MYTFSDAKIRDKLTDCHVSILRSKIQHGKTTLSYMYGLVTLTGMEDDNLSRLRNQVFLVFKRNIHPLRIEQ